jgi:hypothetical protein
MGAWACLVWIVDKGTAHRGPAAAQRLREKYPNLVLVHGPVHASWLNVWHGSYNSRGTLVSRAQQGPILSGLGAAMSDERTRVPSDLISAICQSKMRPLTKAGGMREGLQGVLAGIGAAVFGSSCGYLLLTSDVDPRVALTDIAPFLGFLVVPAALALPFLPYLAFAFAAVALLSAVAGAYKLVTTKASPTMDVSCPRCRHIYALSTTVRRSYSLVCTHCLALIRGGKEGHGAKYRPDACRSFLGDVVPRVGRVAKAIDDDLRPITDLKSGVQIYGNGGYIWTLEPTVRLIDSCATAVQWLYHNGGTLPADVLTGLDENLRTVATQIERVRATKLLLKSHDEDFERALSSAQSTLSAALAIAGPPALQEGSSAV